MLHADVRDEQSGVIDESWLREQVDLLDLEEGLTGHPLTGAYYCVNGVQDR